MVPKLMILIHFLQTYGIPLMDSSPPALMSTSLPQQETPLLLPPFKKTIRIARGKSRRKWSWGRRRQNSPRSGEIAKNIMGRITSGNTSKWAVGISFVGSGCHENAWIKLRLEWKMEQGQGIWDLWLSRMSSNLGNSVWTLKLIYEEEA